MEIRITSPDGYSVKEGFDLEKLREALPISAALFDAALVTSTKDGLEGAIEPLETTLGAIITAIMALEARIAEQAK